MALTMETSESTELGSQFLDKAGTYHVAVLDTDEQPVTKDHKPIDAFQVQVEILAGDQAKRTARILFNNPNLSHKDGGEFSKRLQTRFLEIVGLIGAEQKGKQVSVELSDCRGRQFIATFTEEEYNGKKQIKLDGGKFWHIDDPAAEKCERSQAALNLIPKAMRRDPASFKKVEAGKNGSTNGSANGNGVKSAPPIDTDDL